MRLTELEQELLEYMGNAAEPTWIFLKEMPELEGDRERLERILVDFEARGLVTRTREPSGNPDGDFMAPENWWDLTPLGKTMLPPL